jgi:hypothetical protein
MALKTSIAETAVERLAGRQVSRARALLAASAAAVGAGVLVYRLLRSGEREEADATRGS